MIIQRVDKRLLQQALEVAVQSVLYSGVAGVTLRPLSRDPVFEPRRVAAFLHVQHQVRTQAVEQALAVFHAGANLPFQQGRDPWQQLSYQLSFIGGLNHRVDLFPLIKTASFVVTHIAFFREHLSRRVEGVKGLEHRH